MREKLVLPAVLAVGGTAVGAALWLSGLDARMQAWIWLNYTQGFNSVMRILGELGLGRTQLLVSFLIGLIWAWREVPRISDEKKVRFVWRVVAGMVEQVWLWLRGRWRWAASWQGVSIGPRVFLAIGPLMALSGIAQLVMKIAVGRPRPKMLFWHGEDPFAIHPFGMDAGYWSFPSGHATSTFALVVWIALWFPKYRVPLLVLGCCLAASRFLAATPHYVGDVVAGAGLGAAVAVFVFSCMGGRKRV